MSIRRNHQTGSHSSKSQARNARIREKTVRMRERVKASTQAFFERREAHMAWWQRAFRAPLIAFNWIFSQSTTLWAAMLTILGLKPKSKTIRLEKRHHDIKRSRKSTKRIDGNRKIAHEALEQRQLLAGDLYVGNTTNALGNTVDFIETANGAGTWGVIDNGDTVIWAGPDGDVNTAGDNVPNLTYGTNAFGSIQAAVNAAASTLVVDDGDTIKVAPGEYQENISINKNLTLLASGGRDITQITGISGVGSLGTVVLTGGTTDVQIGDTSRGFTIVGVDNNQPGLENGAVYFQGNHSGASIFANEIRANGDAGLVTEFGASISGFTITGNTFSGKTFQGANPAGDGFGTQFTLANVPRQLVAMGNSGADSTTNITFTNNHIVGIAGGTSLTDNNGLPVAAHAQGNTLVTLDVANSTISGNTFEGTTARFGTSLRTRRPNTAVTGNTFLSSGLTPTTGHIFTSSSATQTLAQIGAANNFDSAWQSTSSLSGTINSGLVQFASLNPALISQIFIGGPGVQTVPFTGPASEYTVTTDTNTGVLTVTDSVPNRDGTDTLQGIEVVRFADGVRLPASNQDSTLNATVSATSIQLSVGTVPVATYPTGMLTPLVLDGGDGDDTFNISLQAGAVLPAAGLTIAGGVGDNDSLNITGAPSGNAVFNYTNANDGSVVIPGVGTVNYTGLDPFSYSSSGGTLTFNLTASSDDVVVTKSGNNVVLTAATIETTTVDLTGITSITINSGGGTDKVTINDALTQNVTLNVNEVVLNAAITGVVTGTANFVTVNVGGKIQNGVDVAAASANINVGAGTFIEDVNANKSGITLSGASAALTTISGSIGGGGASVQVSASNVTIQDLRITREGNNTTDWNNPGLNSAGVAVQGTSFTGMTVQRTVIEGNRTGIDINNTSGHVIVNNSITNNRTGMILRNQTNNLTVHNNFITDNWTAGVLFLDGSGGSNSPLQQALNSSFRFNNISGNWYAQVEDRQSGGSLSAPGTNLKNFSANWFGNATPTVSTVQGGEPGYPGQIPVAFGGFAVAPTPGAGLENIRGSASANIDFSPTLVSGVDSSASLGFQPDLSHLLTHAAGAQTGASGRIQEAIDILADGTLVGGARKVEISAGTYDETFVVNKSATIDGMGVVNIVRTSGTQQIIATVNATNVTIRDLNIEINQNNNGSGQPIAPVGIGATPLTTSDFNGLTLANNTITSIGNAPANWSGTPGLSVRAAGIVLVDSPSGGVPAVSLTNNNVSISSGTSFFQRAVWLAQLNAQVTGNTFAGFANDLLIQFPSGGASLIDSNNFVGVHILGGSGLQIADPNANAPVTITNNNFTPVVTAFTGTSLQVNRNVSTGSPVAISGNIFNGTNLAIDVGGARDVSVAANTFTPKASLTGYIHVRVNSQNASNNADTATPVNSAITGNTFNAALGSTGTAIQVLNTLVGSNFTGVGIGTAADNTYNTGVTTGIEVTGGVANVSDAVQGTATGLLASGGTVNLSSSGFANNTVGISLGGTSTLNVGSGNSISGGVTGLAISGSSVDITGKTLNNLVFSGQSGQYVTLGNGAFDNLILDAISASFDGNTGATASLAQNFSIEDKITHSTDDLSVGFVRVKSGNVFVTTNSGSIQRGVESAQAGDSVHIAAGTFTENVNVNKKLSVTGAGSAIGQTQVNGNITISGSGASVSDRLIVSDLSVTNAAPNGDGVTLANGVQFITLDDVATINNAADGVEILGGALTTSDIVLQNMRINDNGTGPSGTGIRMGGLANVNGLSLIGSEVKRNAQIGFSYNSSASATGLTNVLIQDTVFEHNGDATYSATNQLGTGDISFFSFNGNATIQNVSVIGGPSSNAAHIGVQFRGHGTPAAAGTITIDGLSISGSYRRPTLASSDPTGPGYGLVFMNYSSVTNVSLDDVDVNVNDGHALFVAGLTTTLNLSNTSLNAQNSNAAHILVGTSTQNVVASNVDATGVTFASIAASTATLPQLFAIEDKIVHKVDVDVLGFVRVKTANVYVTPLSNIPPFTPAPDIQRGVNAASSGDTINIAAGTYTGNVDASTGGKDLKLSAGNSPAQVTINGNLTLNSGDTLAIEALGTNPLTQYDNFIVNGTVTLSGASIDLAVTNDPPTFPVHGSSLTIIDNDGTDSITGEFSNTTTNAITGAKSIASTKWDLTSGGGNGNDFVLSFDDDADVGDDLFVGITPLFINPSNVAAVPFTIVGLDSDAVATITFTDSASNTVVLTNVTASGSANLSTLVDGNITVTISVVDNVGNTATGTGDSATKDLQTPSVTINTGLSFALTATKTITSSNLTTTDPVPGSSSSGLTYQLTSIPSNGTLFRNNVALAVNSTFTQADVNANLLTFTASTLVATSGFGFNVSDSAGNMASGSFSISTSAVRIEFSQAPTSASESANSGGPILLISGDLTGVPAPNRTIAFFALAPSFSNDATLPGTFAIPAANYGISGQIDLQSFGALALDIINDATVEGPETFTVQISPAMPPALTLFDIDSNAVAQTIVNHTIVDDDFASFSYSNGSTSLSEAAGTGNEVPVRLTITSPSTPDVGFSTKQLGQTIAVRSTRTDVTATSGSDFNAGAAARTVTFGAGSLDGDEVDAQVFNVTNDRLIEGNETTNLVLSITSGGDPTGQASVIATPHVVTLVDDDSASVDVGTGPIAVTEGGASATANVVLTLTGVGTGALQLGPGVTISAALNPSSNPDFTSSTATFGPGSVSGTTATISVSAVNDNLVEDVAPFTNPEVFPVGFVASSVPTLALLTSSGSRTVVVTDNDQHSLSGAASVNEGATYTLTLSTADTTVTSWLVS